MNTRGHSTHLRAGFSLLEIMVVLVILAIVAAVIVPEMRGTYEGELLRSASRKLAAAAALASSQAVALNQDHQLTIDSREGRFFIARNARDVTDGAPSAVQDVPGGEGAFDNRIAVEIRDSAEGEEVEEAAASAIVFHPDGTAESKEIRLRDRDGFGMALKIYSATARVQIIDLGKL